MKNLRIYPSTLPGEPIETHEIDGITLGQWLHANVDGYHYSAEHPISITVDGVVVPPGEWDSTLVTSPQHVEIRPQPKSGGLLIAAVIGGVLAAAAALILLKPSIPNVQTNRRSRRGSSIYEVNAQGNRPKLGDVIPEIAGRHKTFPDILTSPRRYFVDKKAQALDLLLNVGKGEYSIDTSGLKIGQTGVNLLGSTVDFQIFEPGQDVSGHVSHRRWYNAPEVGATSGGSGIRLLSVRDLEQDWPEADTLSGFNIDGPNRPETWETGVVLSVSFDFPVTVSGSGTGINTFSGDIGYLDPFTDVEVDLSPQQPSARFRVSSWDSGAQEFTLERLDGSSWVTVDNFDNGPRTMSITRWNEVMTYKITDVPSSGLDVILQLDGSDVSGWTGFPAGATSINVSISQSVTVGIWMGPFQACPDGETTDLLEWDIFAPAGLGFVEDNGDVSGRFRSIELRYRPKGTSTWTTVSRQIFGRTRDQIGWTFSQSISSMTPEVQVRRLGAEDNDVQALDRLEWFGLRSELPGAKTSYPGVTTIAMTIEGSNVIASQTENQVNVVAHRKLPTLDGAGGFTSPQTTRSITAWMAYVAKSVGYTDAELDLAEMQRLEDIWSARGDTFDFVHDDDGTVKETLQRTLRAGMAELTVDAGRLRPVRDEPRTAFEHMYTPQNMLEPLRRTVRASRPDDPDGVDVEYFDQTTWTQETVEARLPGDSGVRPEKVRLDGVVDRARAWRIGMRRRRELKFRRWEYDFSTELDALNSRYLSYDALADDIPGYGQSSLLKALVDNGGGEYVLLVSEPMDWSAGGAHVVAWRRPDGTLAGPFPATQGADDFQIIAQAGGEPAPSLTVDEPPHVLFGNTERWSYAVLVQDINPQGFEQVNVKAVGYDERVYEDDDSLPA